MRSPERLRLRGGRPGFVPVMLASLASLPMVLAAGCSLRTPVPITDPSVQQAAHYKNVALEMEYPNEPVPERKDDFASFAPHVIREGPPQYWDMKLDEALKLAMVNSPVLRDLGGQVLVNPQSVRTVQGPAITETDPNYGVEAALSQFDADLSATGNWQNNHRALNNSFFGGGTRLFQQDLNQYQVQLAKRAATGGQYFLRQNTTYDANNAPANLFPHSWDTNIEVEARQPLLQGAGVLYNRIAGPNGTVGQAAGVLIARVNTDISLAEFELGVRNLISNVENAYWDLYFAYRDLHAKIVARDSALETWRRIHALFVTGRRGGEADKEAQARDQYYFFQAEVEDALTGRLFDGTRTNNGSSGGTFRANPGVYVTERRLRLTMGLPPNDPRLIRPAEEPLQARVCFDWEQLTQEAISRRAELRRQRAFVKRRELELIAARNFLLPRLDADALYRWRGFGHNLINYGDNPQFDNAAQTLFGGQFQEWQLGAQFDMPIGFRQGHAAVRNAQLILARERAILREMELQVVHDLSNVVGDVDRSYIVAQTNYNRRVAAAQQMAAVEAAFEADTASLLDLVESQRRLADADSRYARSMVEYTLSVKNVMFESNTLLENNGINMAEGPWPHKAYHDAEKRDELRSRPTRLSYVLPQGPLVDRGIYAQHQFPPAVMTEGKGNTIPTVPAGSAPGEAVPPSTGTPVGEELPSNGLPSPGSSMPGTEGHSLELRGPVPNPDDAGGPPTPLHSPVQLQEGTNGASAPIDNSSRVGGVTTTLVAQGSSLNIVGGVGAPLPQGAGPTRGAPPPATLNFVPNGPPIGAPPLMLPQAMIQAAPQGLGGFAPGTVQRMSLVAPADAGRQFGAVVNAAVQGPVGAMAPSVRRAAGNGADPAPTGSAAPARLDWHALGGLSFHQSRGFAQPRANRDNSGHDDQRSRPQGNPWHVIAEAWLRFLQPDTARHAARQRRRAGDRGKLTILPRASIISGTKQPNGAASSRRRNEVTTTKQLIRVGHSPDPDDAFMFHALANDKIDTGDYEFRHELVDIETLNRRAFSGQLELTAVSLHGYAYLTDIYALCPCGASMGDKYGPMVVAKKKLSLDAVREKSIAVPGTLTTAYLALRMCLARDFTHVVVPFDQILDAVEAGEFQGKPVDAGLIIHEGQLTYGERKLELLVDLGQWWYAETGLPLPLGANAIRKDLGPEVMRDVNRLLKESIRYGLEHRDEALDYALQYGRDLDRAKADTFVGMYVNDWTLDFGPRGRKAVQELLARGHAAGVIPQKIEPEFVD